jgi:hypothetical protein
MGGRTEAMKNDDLNELQKALRLLQRQALRPRLAFRIAHAAGALKSAFDALNEGIETIRHKHLILDAEGRAVKETEGENAGGFKIREGGSKAEYDREAEELFETDSQATIPNVRITIEELEQSNVLLSADTVLALGPLVVFPNDETAPVKDR